MLHAKLAAQAPSPDAATRCGSQIFLHWLATQTSPATQVSAPPLTPMRAREQGAPSGLAPSETQPVWPIWLVDEVGSRSTTQVHFSPAIQPVWRYGLHAIGASTAASTSFTPPPPPPHAAT